MIHGDRGYAVPKDYDPCWEWIEQMRVLNAWADDYNKRLITQGIHSYAEEAIFHAEKQEIDTAQHAIYPMVVKCRQKLMQQEGRFISLEGGSPPRTAPSIVKDALNIKTKTDLNYSLGHATKQECEKAARQFLGPGWRWSRNGEAKVSADGMRIYRAPKVKPNRGRLVQANFEVKAKPGEVSDAFFKIKKPIFNGHLYILNP